MEQKENNNLGTGILSEQEKKFATYGVVFSTILILILITLIAEAYINQHPVFEFLQYAAFKPGMEILGSISLSIMYIGVLFYLIIQCVLLLYNYQLRKIFIVPIVVSSSVLLYCYFLLFFCL